MAPWLERTSIEIVYGELGSGIRMGLEYRRVLVSYMS